MGSRPLTVLLVSGDRALLRRLSKFLSMLGYEAQQAAGLRQAAAAREAQPVDFAIVDAGAGWADSLQVVREVAGPGRAGIRCYIFLLTSSQDLVALDEALAAGVDDFLAKPVVYGELLARLRAGARELEYERRLQEQIGVEPVTRLPSHTAFEVRLEAALSAESAARGAACVLLDLDFLRRVNRIFGESAGEEVLRAVAARLSDLRKDEEMLASFGGGTFAFLVPALSEAEAVAWADGAREALADTEFAYGDQRLHLTFSAGVVSVRGAAGRTAESVLREAAKALRVAKTMGRNCVASFTELEEDAKVQAEFATLDQLFERTLARDVMTPCPCVVRAGDSSSRVAEVLRRAQLDAVAVVDRQERLVGLAAARSAPVGPADVKETRAKAGDTRAKVGDVMLTEVPAYEEDTPLPTLIDFFRDDLRSHVVITRDRRPVGIVTLDNLAALGSPLNADSFRPTVPFSRTSDYLVVPDICPATAPKA